MADTTVPVGDRATVPVEPFKVMLIGNAGAGKSSTGNTILSGDGEAVSTYFTVAEIDDASQTREPKVWMRTVLGYNIEIIDTMGVVDRTNREFNTHLKCIFDKQGVDAVLIVIPCQSNPHLLNKRDRESVKYMTNLCGDEFWKHCIFVLTYGNTFHEYVRNKSPIPTFEQEMSAHRFNVFNKDRFDAWKEKAKGGAVLFENKETNLQKRLEMVTNLLEKVEFLRAINEGKQLRPKIPQRKWYKFGV